VVGELASLESLHGRATGEYLFLNACETLMEGVKIDVAPSMTGKVALVV
jgi:hypothetical protein